MASPHPLFSLVPQGGLDFGDVVLNDAPTFRRLVVRNLVNMPLSITWQRSSPCVKFQRGNENIVGEEVVSSNAIFDAVGVVDDLLLPAEGQAELLCGFIADPQHVALGPQQPSQPVVFNGVVEFTAAPADKTPVGTPTSQGGAVVYGAHHVERLPFTATLCLSVMAVTPTDLPFSIVPGKSQSREYTIVNYTHLPLKLVFRLQAMQVDFRLAIHDYDTPELPCLGQHMTLQPHEARKFVLSVTTTTATRPGNYKAVVQCDNLRDTRNTVLITAHIKISADPQREMLCIPSHPDGIIDFGHRYVGDESQERLVLQSLGAREELVVVFRIDGADVDADDVVVCAEDDDGGAEGGVLDELVLDPGKTATVIAKYTPKVSETVRTPARVKFHVLIEARGAKGEIFVSTLAARATLHRSDISLLTGSVNFGDCKVGQRKHRSIVLENHAEIDGAAVLQLESKVISIEGVTPTTMGRDKNGRSHGREMTARVALPAGSKVTLNVSILPRRVNPSYRKQMTIINAFNAEQHFIVNFEANTMPNENSQLHDELYSCVRGFHELQRLVSGGGSATGEEPQHHPNGISQSSVSAAAAAPGGGGGGGAVAVAAAARGKDLEEQVTVLSSVPRVIGYCLSSNSTSSDAHLSLKSTSPDIQIFALKNGISDATRAQFERRAELLYHNITSSEIHDSAEIEERLQLERDFLVDFIRNSMVPLSKIVVPHHAVQRSSQPDSAGSDDTTGLDETSAVGATLPEQGEQLVSHTHNANIGGSGSGPIQIYIVILRTLSYSSFTSKEDSIAIACDGIESLRYIRVSYRLCSTKLELGQGQLNKYFGTVPIGERKHTKITIVNPCEAPLYFSITKSQNSVCASHLRIANTTVPRYCGFVRAFAKHELEIVFFPSLRGSFKEPLTITNVLNPVNSVVVTMKAEVEKVETFEVNPSALFLGEVGVEQKEVSVSSRVMLTNTSKHRREFTIKLDPSDSTFVFDDAKVTLALDIEQGKSGGSSTRKLEEELDHIEKKLKIYERKGKVEKAEKARKRIEQLKKALLGEDEGDGGDPDDAALAYDVDSESSEDDTPGSSGGGMGSIRGRVRLHLEHREIYQESHRDGITLPPIGAGEQYSVQITAMCKKKEPLTSTGPETSSVTLLFFESRDTELCKSVKCHLSVDATTLQETRAAAAAVHLQEQQQQQQQKQFGGHSQAQAPSLLMVAGSSAAQGSSQSTMSPLTCPGTPSVPHPAQSEISLAAAKGFSFGAFFGSPLINLGNTIVGESVGFSLSMVSSRDTTFVVLAPSRAGGPLGGFIEAKFRFTPQNGVLRAGEHLTLKGECIPMTPGPQKYVVQIKDLRAVTNGAKYFCVDLNPIFDVDTLDVEPRALSFGSVIIGEGSSRLITHGHPIVLRNRSDRHLQLLIRSTRPSTLFVLEESALVQGRTFHQAPKAVSLPCHVSPKGTLRVAIGVLPRIDAHAFERARSRELVAGIVIEAVDGSLPPRAVHVGAQISRAVLHLSNDYVDLGAISVKKQRRCRCSFGLSNPSDLVDVTYAIESVPPGVVVPAHALSRRLRPSEEYEVVFDVHADSSSGGLVQRQLTVVNLTAPQEPVTFRVDVLFEDESVVIPREVIFPVIPLHSADALSESGADFSMQLAQPGVASMCGTELVIRSMRNAAVRIRPLTEAPLTVALPDHDVSASPLQSPGEVSGNTSPTKLSRNTTPSPRKMGRGTLAGCCRPPDEDEMPSPGSAHSEANAEPPIILQPRRDTVTVWTLAAAPPFAAAEAQQLLHSHGVVTRRFKTYLSDASTGHVISMTTLRVPFAVSEGVVLTPIIDIGHSLIDHRQSPFTKFRVGVANRSQHVVLDLQLERSTLVRFPTSRVIVPKGETVEVEGSIDLSRLQGDKGRFEEAIFFVNTLNPDNDMQAVVKGSFARRSWTYHFDSKPLVGDHPVVEMKTMGIEFATATHEICEGRLSIFASELDVSATLRATVVPELAEVLTVAVLDYETTTAVSLVSFDAEHMKRSLRLRVIADLSSPNMARSLANYFFPTRRKMLGTIAHPTLAQAKEFATTRLTASAPCVVATCTVATPASSEDELTLMVSLVPFDTFTVSCQSRLILRPLSQAGVRAAVDCFASTVAEGMGAAVAATAPVHFFRGERVSVRNVTNGRLSLAVRLVIDREKTHSGSIQASSSAAAPISSGVTVLGSSGAGSTSGGGSSMVLGNGTSVSGGMAAANETYVAWASLSKLSIDPGETAAFFVYFKGNGKGVVAPPMALWITDEQCACASVLVDLLLSSDDHMPVEDVVGETNESLPFPGDAREVIGEADEMLATSDTVGPGASAREETLGDLGEKQVRESGKDAAAAAAKTGGAEVAMREAARSNSARPQADTQTGNSDDPAAPLLLLKAVSHGDQGRYQLNLAFLEDTPPSPQEIRLETAKSAAVAFTISVRSQSPRQWLTVSTAEGVVTPDEPKLVRLMASSVGIGQFVAYVIISGATTRGSGRRSAAPLVLRVVADVARRTSVGVFDALFDGVKVSAAQLNAVEQRIYGEGLSTHVLHLLNRERRSLAFQLNFSRVAEQSLHVQGGQAPSNILALLNKAVHPHISHWDGDGTEDPICMLPLLRVPYENPNQTAVSNSLKMMGVSRHGLSASTSITLEPLASRRLRVSLFCSPILELEPGTSVSFTLELTVKTKSARDAHKTLLFNLTYFAGRFSISPEDRIVFVPLSTISLQPSQSGTPGTAVPTTGVSPPVVSPTAPGPASSQLGEHATQFGEAGSTRVVVKKLQITNSTAQPLVLRVLADKPLATEELVTIDAESTATAEVRVCLGDVASALQIQQLHTARGVTNPVPSVRIFDQSNPLYFIVVRVHISSGESETLSPAQLDLPVMSSAIHPRPLSLRATQLSVVEALVQHFIAKLTSRFTPQLVSQLSEASIDDLESPIMTSPANFERSAMSDHVGDSSMDDVPWGNAALPRHVRVAEDMLTALHNVTSAIEDAAIASAHPPLALSACVELLVSGIADTIPVVGLELGHPSSFHATTGGSVAIGDSQVGLPSGGGSGVVGTSNSSSSRRRDPILSASAPQNPGGSRLSQEDFFFKWVEALQSVRRCVNVFVNLNVTAEILAAGHSSNTERFT